MRSFSFKLSDIYTYAAIWSYLLMPNMLPMPLVSGFAVVLVTRFFVARYFSDVEIPVSFDRSSLVLFGSFFLFLVLGHNSNLLLPLNSDEPHHAERTLFLLKAAFPWIESSLGLLPYEVLRKDYWSLLDPRVMEAGTLWQILFWIFTGAVAGIFALWNWGYQKRRDFAWRMGIDTTVIAAFAGLGWLFYGWPDNHPPLRTLAPFLSAGVFGFSELAFRISGLLVLALFMVWLYRRIAPHFSPVVSIAITLFSVLMPTVFFNAALMEPAVYAFIGWAVVLTLLLEAYETGDDKKFTFAVALIPVFVLFRHTCLFLFLPAGLIYFLKFWRKIKLPWTSALVLILLSAPYFWALKVTGNSAGSVDFSPDKFLQILTNGKPIVAIVNSIGILWTSALLATLGLVILNIRKLHWFLGTWVAIFFLYHLITIETAWGIARYQVEFIAAPMVVAVVWLLKNYRVRAPILIALVSLLGFATFYQVKSIPKDIAATDYQALRITNTSFYPVDQAVSYLHRENVGAGFLFIGGTTPTYESVLWFQGYDLVTSRLWLAQAYEFQQFQEQGPTWELMDQYFKSRKIKYLAVNRGLQRDVTSQSGPVKKIMGDIDRLQTGNVKLKYERSYESEFGGILDLYRLLE